MIFFELAVALAVVGTAVAVVAVAVVYIVVVVVDFAVALVVVVVVAVAFAAGGVVVVVVSWVAGFVFVEYPVKIIDYFHLSVCLHDFASCIYFILIFIFIFVICRKASKALYREH